MLNSVIPPERLAAEREASFGKMAKWGLLISPLLNLSWIALDGLYAPDYCNIFLLLRLLYVPVSVGIFILLTRKKISMELASHLSFSTIMLQIAYMCNVVPENALHLYHMGAAAFFLGVGSMIVWRPVNGYIFLGYAITISLSLYFLFHQHSLETQLGNDLMLNVTTWLFPVFAGGLRYNNFYSQVSQRYSLEISNAMVAAQKSSLERAYERITDSINYARKIQNNLLPGQRQ